MPIGRDGDDVSARRPRVSLLAGRDRLVRLARHRRRARGEIEAILGAALVAVVAIAVWHLVGAVSADFNGVLISVAASR